MKTQAVRFSFWLVWGSIGLAVGGAYAGYKYQNNRNRQQGISGASTGTGAKSPKSTAGYTGTAKQNKSQSNNRGSSSYQSTSNQNASKNNGYTTNTGLRSVSGTQQKTGTVPKDSGTKSSSKACSATGNTGVKQPSKVPNKAVKTGVALEAPVVVELLPQAWPWIMEGGKTLIGALAGMGIVKFVGGMFGSKAEEKERPVEPEGEVSEENKIEEAEKARQGGRKRKRHRVVKDKNSLPAEGEPNSSADLLNPDGNVKQRRYYGPDGKAQEDIDYNHTDDGTHSFPYKHKWDWDKIPPRQDSR